MMGVYAITNKTNGKMYVGSARDVAARWRSHRFELRGGRHHSVRLQRAWNKYGESSFELQTLEIVTDETKLRAAEQRWMDFLLVSQRGIGYNTHPQAIGGHPIGWRPPLSAIMKLRDGRQRGVNNVNAKLTEDDVKAICARAATGESAQRIAVDYNVTATAIWHIVNGKTWTHVDAPRIKNYSAGKRGMRRGGAHGMAKLTEDDVHVIKQRIADGDLQRIIAADYGVQRELISKIARGVRWSHVV